MKQFLLGCAAFLILVSSRLLAQLPENCKTPMLAGKSRAVSPSAGLYDALGSKFAESGDLKCAAAAFEQALKLSPRSAEAHFDLALVRQRQKKPEMAINELQLALQYDPGLLQAHCALGSLLPDSKDAEPEFRKVLKINSKAVCALDGLAQVLADQRRYDAALVYWRKALSIQPEAVDLQLAYATAIYQAAKAKEAAGLNASDDATVADAIQLFSELLTRHPELTAAHFTLANIYANEQRYREAADEYEKVTEQNPSHMVALLARVEALVKVSAYEQALAPAQQYVSRNPDDASGHVLLGTVYRGMGDYAKAEPELELGIKKQPDNFQARYQLGFVLARLGNLREAVTQLREAATLKPGDKSAEFQLAEVLHKLGQNQEADEIVKQFQKATENAVQKSQLLTEGNQANELLQSGKAEEAATIYRQMLLQDPQNAWTAYNLGLALEETHDSEGAQDAMQRAASLDPKMAVARAELGQLRLAAGDITGARNWLESALTLEPQLVAARGNLAMIHAMKGELSTAEKLLRQALEDDPKYKEGHLNLGLILAQEGRTSDAERELNKAIELAPHDPTTLSTAGKTLAQMGKMSEGIELLRRVVQLAPDLAAAHLDLALALADSYDLPGALVETSEAVRLAPQSGVAHLNRGRVLFDMGRAREAKPEFETACRFLPQMSGPRYFLALIEKQAGNYQGAANLLDEVVHLQPKNVMAWYLLGQSLQEENETAKAIAAWRQAIAIDPNFSQALFNLARSLRSTNGAEADQFMARYTTVQKERRILDRMGTLANNATIAASAHDWPEATRDLKEAIMECGDCTVKADLYKRLGLIECQSGDLASGEKELLTANTLKPSDPEVANALELIAQARRQQTTSDSNKAH
jgi:tetratricopeptide (TPR) repeat protein